MRCLCIWFVFLTLSCPAFAAQDDPILLGAVFAKTGLAANPNVQNYTLTRFAVEEINDQGGLLGRRVVLLEYDNRSSALGARAAAERAIQDGVCAVVGPFWSSQAYAMARVLQKAGVPMIAAAATSDGISRIGDFIFQAGFLDSFQAALAADVARTTLGAKTAAILTNISTPYSTGMAEHFSAHFKRAGGRIVHRGEYLMDTADFAAQLEAIKTHAPDIVFVPGHSRDAALILKQAEDMGLSATFIGGDGWSNLFQSSTFSTDLSRRHYFISHWHPQVPIPASRAMLARFTAARGAKAAARINGAHILTYDAVGLFADAVRRAGSCDPAAIRRALASTIAYPGATGPITFSSHGSPIKGAVLLGVGRNKTIEYIKSLPPKKP